jgi:hypothetical protein
MDVLTLVVDEKSLTPTEHPQWYKSQIKIDHPLANNNPNAVFFIQAQMVYQPQYLLFQYDGANWHLEVAPFRVDSVPLYDIVENVLDEYPIKGVEFADWMKSGGLAHGMPYTPCVGNRYSFIVFRLAPDHNFIAEANRSFK